MGAGNSKRSVARRRPSITELFDEGHPIDAALRLGVRDALLRHKQLGQRVATWENGRVVVLEPADIRIDEAGQARPPRARPAARRSSRARKA